MIRGLPASVPARGLDPWRRPKGSWALGTRMLIGLNAMSDLVSGSGEIFFSAGVFFIGIDILRGVKMWESEGVVNVGSISRFCECDLL